MQHARMDSEGQAREKESGKGLTLGRAAQAVSPERSGCLTLGVSCWGKCRRHPEKPEAGSCEEGLPGSWGLEWPHTAVLRVARRLGLPALM